MIEIKNLTKRYGQINAVNDITLSIKKGEILGFLGPNGAGKSTTMNILTGYLSATSGSVTINGINIAHSPIEAKKLIGYLPENPPLYQDMTVKEYLKFICELKQIPSKERKSQLEEALYLVKMEDVQGRLIKNLSKGYKQRVGLAQAIVGNPQVLILDEPTVGLDPKQIVEIRKLISTLRHNRTIILSTHILQEVSAVCSSVAMINKGRLAATGSVSEFTASGTVNKFNISIVGASGKPEAQKVLGSVDGVRKVDFIRMDKDSYIFNVESEKNTDVRRMVFNELARNNMAVIELRPVGRSLEEIFIDIVNKEQSAEVEK